MGGLFDVEASSAVAPPKKTCYSMMGRGVGEVRRRFLFLTVAGLLILATFIGVRRHEQVRNWVDHARFEDHIPFKGTTRQFPGLVDPLVKGDDGPVLDHGQRSLSAKSLTDLRNQTLGFGNIWVINMEERSDKLDAMRLTSSITGFKFDVQPAVDGSKVALKALSKDFPPSVEHDGQIGCWRSHMAFATNIVTQNLGSALIMEDDADWDVSLRSQLEIFALGSQTLLGSSTKGSPFSPYGDDWDVLWLGHCASQPMDDDWRRVLWRNDRTVTPPSHRVNYGGIPDMSTYDNSTRTQYFSKGGTCTYAYGLSYHGAQKMLKWLSMDVYNMPIDFGLHDMCSKPERGFKCISVFPQIIADHKAAGSSSKDSDIGGAATSFREKGFSFNIVHNTRLNADALIDGAYENVTAQWPSEMPQVSGPVRLEYENVPIANTPQ